MTTAHGGADWSETPSYLLPTITPEAEEFFAGTLRGELRVQRCTGCGLHQHYPRLGCSHCGGAELEWITASGRGSIHSYTVVRQNGLPPFGDRVPFVVALVDLDEPGARMIAAMPSLDPADAEIGLPVVAEFRPASDALAFVDFRLARPEGRIA